MRVRPPPGDYNVEIEGEVVLLHVTEEGAWYENAEGKMIHFFWWEIGGGPVLLSFTSNGLIGLGLDEGGTVSRVIHDNETGETRTGGGHYVRV